MGQKTMMRLATILERHEKDVLNEWVDQQLAAVTRRRDLVNDPLVRFIDRTFVLWAVLGFVVPFGLGYALTGGQWRGAFTGLLWGGLVRMFGS